MRETGERARERADTDDDGAGRAAVQPLFDAVPDPALTGLVELTARLLRVPAAQVTLLRPEGADVVASTGPDAAPLLVPAGADETVVEDGAPGPFPAWAAVVLTGVDGDLLGSLAVRDTAPRRWDPADLTALRALSHAVSAEVARQAVLRREREAQVRADFQAALLAATNEATQDGVLVVSPAGDVLSYNARFLQIWPLDRERVGSAEAVRDAVLAQLADPETFVARVREHFAVGRASREEIALRDGRVLDSYGSPLRGTDGTTHGYVWFVRDVSAERDARRALEQGEARYRSLVSLLTDEVWRCSPDGELLVDMPAWRSVTRQTPEELLGHGWIAGIHPEDRARAAATWERAWRTGAVYETEYRIAPVRGEGPTRTLEVRGVPLVRDGQVAEWVGLYVDVTEQRAAQETERQLAARVAMAAESTRVLQEVTAALSGAVSTGDVMQVIVEKGQELLGASGSGVALRSGDRVRYELLTGYSADVKSGWSEFGLTEDTPVTRVIHTGEPLFVSSPDELDGLFPGNERLRAFVETSGECSLARLPLLTPSGVLGVLGFGFSQVRTFSDDERQFLLALAGQCAQAIERAQLYERERGTARMLQRSLLPDALPLVLGMRLSAVCETRAADMDVGGDWYDAVIVGDGRVALAVGDVRGRGVRAASVMGQVRNALRGLVHADPSPSALLGWLDSVVTQLGDDEEFVTLVYALVDPATGELEWACAGHMPPLVIGAGGARYLGGAESLPLGLGGERPSSRLTLEPGESLVLFSDGLVENRRRPLGTGLRELLDRAEELASETPSAELLRDGLTGSMVDARDTDDVTVLAVRRAQESQGAGHAPLVAQIDLPARTTSPGAAREFVGARLGEWGAKGVLDETLLCVSEIVTNAVVHAGSAVHLELHCGEGVLRVDVRDSGRPTLPPARPAAADDDTHGRGLMLVDVICDRWGVVEEAEGKVVWFELEVPAA